MATEGASATSGGSVGGEGASSTGDVGANGGGSSGGVNIGPIPQIPRSRLREILEHAQGECIMYKCIFYVYKGGGHCGMCWGTCCPLVNTVLNTLVQAGELSADAEVSV